MGRPFIIWTHRRCGGTNLAKSLFYSSSCRAVEHEPFNTDRIFGSLQRKLLEGTYQGNLKDDVRAILRKSILIKHCLEIINKQLNDAILEVSTELNYQHLFLYREFAEDRLLSLNYAQLTGIWGSKQKKEFDSRVFQQDINVEQLIHHEKRTRAETRRIYSRLIDLGATPLAVSFEMLYKSDFNYSSMLVKDIFAGLEVNDSIVTPEFLKQTLRQGKQGTNEQYRKFPNSNKLSMATEKLGRFALTSAETAVAPEINYKTTGDAVKIFKLWKPLPSVYLDKYHYSGIAIGFRDFNLRINGTNTELEVVKGISSPKISLMYPDNPAASKSRFITHSYELVSSIEVKEL